MSAVDGSDAEVSTAFRGAVQPMVNTLHMNAVS